MVLKSELNKKKILMNVSFIDADLQFRIKMQLFIIYFISWLLLRGILWKIFLLSIPNQIPEWLIYLFIYWGIHSKLGKASKVQVRYSCRMSESIFRWVQSQIFITSGVLTLSSITLSAPKLCVLLFQRGRQRSRRAVREAALTFCRHRLEKAKGIFIFDFKFI